MHSFDYVNNNNNNNNNNKHSVFDHYVKVSKQSHRSNMSSIDKIYAHAIQR
jgi:hypothetical protein